MDDVRRLVNSREKGLKMRLTFLQTELKKAQSTTLAILVPTYQNDINEEIKFVKLQLSKIKKARKTTMKVIR